MTDGFLSRWSKRKLDVKQGKPLEEPAVQADQPPPSPPPAVQTMASVDVLAPPPPPPVPLPTLVDAQSLTPDSDFKPFMVRGVATDVKNAAMKKLFTDPHYNVMDGLDTYIDDYSVSDPIPEAMLRQMASAKFLKLFDEKDQEPKPTEGLKPALADDVRDDADTAGSEVVAQSPQMADTSANTPPDSSIEHDHTDLRLQPDHAAASKAAGRGPA